MTTLNVLATDIDSKHPNCLVCDRPVCLWLPDGSLDCFDCELDNGKQVNDDNGPVGHVHDACMEKYVMDAIAHDIEQALQVRLPLGMGPWAAERARNLAVILYDSYVKWADK